MDWNLKKMWPAAAASLVAVTSLANAADDMQMRNLENRVSALEQRKGANGVINPSARPGVRDGWDIFVTGQALYWKPNETGLTYAIRNCPEGSTGSAEDGEVLEARSKYNWGFNVGIGYNMPHDGWDLALNWTRFHTNNGYDCCEKGCDECDECDKCDPCDTGCDTSCDPCLPCNDPCPPVASNGSCSQNACNQCFATPCCCECPPCRPCCFECNSLDCCCNIMFPTNINFAHPCVPPGVWSCDAFSKWQLKLDILDLVLGRDFFVSKYLSLRPNFGLRGLEVRQTQTSVYNAFLKSGCHCDPCFGNPIECGQSECGQFTGGPCSVDTQNFQARVKDNQKYWGVGPKAGLDTLWSFGEGFGLYGNAAISLVYGKFKVKHNETYIFEEFPTSPCDKCDAPCGECSCECVDECPVLAIEGNKTKCDRQYKTRAVTDLAIGLSWDRQFADDKYHLGINVGWEHHMFFGMNQFYRFMSRDVQGAMTTNQGDLATQGLTFGARFDF